MENEFKIKIEGEEKQNDSRGGKKTNRVSTLRADTPVHVCVLLATEYGSHRNVGIDWFSAVMVGLDVGCEETRLIYRYIFCRV